MTTYYRVEDRRVSGGVDEFDNALPGHVVVSLSRYVVVAETPKGLWIAPTFTPIYETRPIIVFSGRRWMPRKARRRFACPTIAEAVESFRARKRYQTRMLRERLRDVETATNAVGHEAERWLREAGEVVP